MNKMMLIIIGVVVVGGGAAAFFLMGGKSADNAAPPPPDPPGILEMDPFLVNIADESGDRFAKLSLKLTISPGKVAESLASDDLARAKMRDRVLTLITAKSLDELIGPIGKEALRREIKAHLKPLIDEGEIDEVLFADFVVQ